MRRITYPPPLQTGTIGVTAPSAGIEPELEPRLQFCVRHAQRLGFDVRLGRCLRSGAIVSAPAVDRARELTDMLLDDEIQAVIPPWGGELLIDLLPLLDFDRLSAAPPKWIVGYSDISTLLLPYTLLTGIATAHGSNFLESPNQVDRALASWRDVLALGAGASFTQQPASLYQLHIFDWQAQPDVTAFNCTEPAAWQCLRHEDEPGYEVIASGRLVGGCLDVVGFLAGTPYGDLDAFARAFAPEGLLVYLEYCDSNTVQYCRMLHHVRMAGWFHRANAILIGRLPVLQLREFMERDALMNALGGLPIPVIYGMDIGHVPPQMMLVNGALAELRFGPGDRSLTQTLA
jgi:muramoyltetrapeptide carboxypeptidase